MSKLVNLIARTPIKLDGKRHSQGETFQAHEHVAAGLIASGAAEVVNRKTKGAAAGDVPPPPDEPPAEDPPPAS